MVQKEPVRSLRGLGGSAAKTPQREKLPPPSIVVDSGHGRHLYWLVREPVEVTPENRPLFKAVNRGLALAVGGDPACCDLARILRLPGFLNWKLPAAEVRVLDVNERRYSLAELQPFAVFRPEARSAGRSGENTRVQGSSGWSDKQQCNYAPRPDGNRLRGGRSGSPVFYPR